MASQLNDSVRASPKKALRALFPSISHDGPTWTVIKDEVFGHIRIPSLDWERIGDDDGVPEGNGIVTFVMAMTGRSKSEATKRVRRKLRAAGLLAPAAPSAEKISEEEYRVPDGPHPTLARNRYAAQPALWQDAVCDIGINAVRIANLLHHSLSIKFIREGHLSQKDEDLWIAASHADFAACGVSGGVGAVIKKMEKAHLLKVRRRGIGRLSSEYQLILSPRWFDQPSKKNRRKR